jgi:hypothetical protein
MMPLRPAGRLLALLAGMVAMACGTASRSASPPVPPPMPPVLIDTVRSHRVTTYEGLAPMLAAVGRETGRLSEAEQARLLARVDSVDLGDSIRVWARASRSDPFADREPFVYPELSTGDASRLAVVVRFVDMSWVEVRFLSADTATSHAARAVVRQRLLTTLAPLGRARIAAIEGRMSMAERPSPRLVLRTEREFGCLGHGIPWRVETRRDTILMRIDGIQAPQGLCPTAMGPAERTHRLLDLAPGRYTLLVESQADTNVFALTLTDSSIAMATERSTFLTADERVYWRTERMTFAFTCNPTLPSEPMCEELQAWVARQPGITRIVGRSDGVHAYPREYSDPEHLTFGYRYASADALRRVRECVESIRPLIANTAGIHISFHTWLDEHVGAGSGRFGSQSHVRMPSSVIGRTPQCDRW